MFLIMGMLMVIAGLIVEHTVDDDEGTHITKNFGSEMNQNEKNY